MSVKERIMTIRLMEKLQANPAYAKALRITADLQKGQQNDKEVQKAMKEECEKQTDLTVWVNKDEHIVTFRDTEGLEKRTFRTQEEKMSYIYNLCESGYRIL